MKIAELNLREQANARQWPNRRFTAEQYPEMRDDPGARRVWITATKWVPYEMVEVCTMSEPWQVVTLRGRESRDEKPGTPFDVPVGRYGNGPAAEGPESAPANAMGKHGCSHAGCDFSATSGAGLAAHVRAKHGGGGWGGGA